MGADRSTMGADGTLQHHQPSETLPDLLHNTHQSWQRLDFTIPVLLQFSFLVHTPPGCLTEHRDLSSDQDVHQDHQHLLQLRSQEETFTSWTHTMLVKALLSSTLLQRRGPELLFDRVVAVVPGFLAQGRKGASDEQRQRPVSTHPLRSNLSSLGEGCSCSNTEHAGAHPSPSAAAKRHSRNAEKTNLSQHRGPPELAEAPSFSGNAS